MKICIVGAGAIGGVIGAKLAANGDAEVSLVARGAHLFGPGSPEIALLRREIGDIPLAGMFCDGEISNARLYGYTGVLALLA